MKKILLASAITLSLTACATGPSAYGPATAKSSLGFENTQIENDRFRISYTGRSLEEAQDYALLRASEIALAEGYSHFKIINGSLEDNNRGGSGVSSSVGVGVGSGRGGYYGRRSSTNVGVGININDLGRALSGKKVTNSIEILLKNSASDEPNMYDARSVNESIRPAVFTE